MRRSQISFLLTIAATLLFLLGLLSGWVLAAWIAQGTPSTTNWLLGLGIIAALITALALWLNRFIQIYFFRIKSFVTEAQLILQSNPDRRLTPSGPRDIHALMALINAYADHFAALINERDEQVQRARSDLETERNVLATLIADLSDGVVVCNPDGRILLYNVQARYLLAPTNTPLHTQVELDMDNEGEPTGNYVGLGRSIFGLLDRNALTYGLKQLQSAQADAPDALVPPAVRATDRTLRFITTATGGGLLRTQMTPLYNEQGSFNGFVLTLHDMTERLASSSRRDRLLQQLTERMRGGLGSIRAAIEMLVNYPTMPQEQLTRFQSVIDEEAQKLGQELDQTMRDFAGDLRAQWHFEEIAGADLLWAIEQFLAEQGITQIETKIASTETQAGLWVRIDSYAVVHGLTNVIRQLRADYGVGLVKIHLHTLSSTRETQDTMPESRRQRRFVTLDVAWSSVGIQTAEWLAWKEKVSTVDDGDATLTLREVAERHGSEIWFQHDPTADKSYFRLLLPRAEGREPAAQLSRPTEPGTQTRGRSGSRPEYYDFDLFGQVSADKALNQRSLGELAYTIFDTETTGLDPQRDEIISIGAVRVLNGRLLRQEIFDQLIDPQKPIPRLATEIHGINDSMVHDQPTIALILPRFARFAEETILVGHNLAFDLRMLEGKSTVTGIQLHYPVLDTLLLSEVLMPDEQNHELETIAERLGVNVVGRHTALGDAFVTAEVFLRMIPMLQAKGITTLEQALTASKQTYMAQIQY